jgi:hypothetical protein
MRTINIANTARRDAQVGFVPPTPAARAVMSLPDGTRPTSIRFIKTVTSTDTLLREHGDLEALGAALVASDPEIDIETVGKLITAPLRMYVTADGQIAYRVRMEQVVYNPDGTERERRELSRNPSNISGETPISPSRRTIAKAEAVRRFVFSRHYQLTHTNGLTFDFLYQMADELQRDGVLRLVGSGPQGTGPLVLTAGGDPYRGFLEGRTDGQRYSLILHLSNLELKPLPTGETA